MIQAERLLLSTALDDHSNQRFILLSDRCASLSIIIQQILDISPMLLYFWIWLIGCSWLASFRLVTHETHMHILICLPALWANSLLDLILISDHVLLHICDMPFFLILLSAFTLGFAVVLRYMTLVIYTNISSLHRGVLWIGR